MENQYFEYKLPKLSKDKEHNKKWFVRYAIRYPGEKEFKYHKEYGRQLYGESLNMITDLSKREKLFKEVIKTITAELERGIDHKNPNLVKEIVEQEIKEKSKYTFDSCFTLYMDKKGYSNPTGKKERSAITMSAFLRNQLRPFLEKNNLIGDLRDVTKSHLQDFIDEHKHWKNNTINAKIAFMGSFFQVLVYKDIIPENPVRKLENKPKQKTERFAIYSMEERDVYFNYLEKHNYPLLAITKAVYYAFIRFSELSRLKVRDFDLDKMRIRIDANNSKTARDKDEYVVIRKPLSETIKEYLSRYPHQPDWYIFGKKLKPSPERLRPGWHDAYRTAIAKLREDNPKLFKNKHLTAYSFKHSGVSGFININIKAKSTTELLQFVMRQCRHSDIKTTMIYWKDLGFELETYTDFIEL